MVSVRRRIWMIVLALRSSVVMLVIALGLILGAEITNPVTQSFFCGAVFILLVLYYGLVLKFAALTFLRTRDPDARFWFWIVAMLVDPVIATVATQLMTWMTDRTLIEHFSSMNSIIGFMYWLVFILACNGIVSGVLMGINQWGLQYRKRPPPVPGSDEFDVPDGWDEARAKASEKEHEIR